MNWNPFRKKQEPTTFPSKFALIRYTKNSKEMGMFDEENKIIEIYKNGLLSETPKTYSLELVKALEEIDEIPVIEEEFEEEQFFFDEQGDFGRVEFRR